MTLHFPIWLLLVFPLAAALYYWRLPTRLLQYLRISSAVLLLVAICGPALKLPSRAGTVVVVADRSESMPPSSDAAQKETIRLLQEAMGTNQQVAVVSFGSTAAVEQPPQSGSFSGFINEVGRDESNLSDAIDKALSLVPEGAPGRILVLSDGRWTGKDPSAGAARAAARGVAIDYRLDQRVAANDVAIAEVDAPGTVTPGEAFMITAWVRSPVQQEVSFELVRNGQPIVAGKRLVPSGLSRVTFRDRAHEPGTHSYTIRLSANADDPVPENNSAKLLVGIQGPKQLLCVTQSQNSGLVRLLQAGDLKLATVTPETASWSLEDLSRYSAVILENVPAEKLGTAAMENIATWVKETGAGMMMTGGKHAFGPGGYFKSKLEPIMPVSMELRREHRKLSMAIVIAMDRSGSMGVSVGPGRTKMDLANVAAVQVLDLMTPMDELGVIAVDSAPHTIVNLAPAEDTSLIRNQVLSIESRGGGIFIFEALQASASMLVNATAGTRHILLFADAADSEEPGKYKELIARCQQAGITISVVGLGKPTDQDADLLRDIAERGGGRCFFTEDAGELPRLFAQDTFVVARSTFIEDATPIEVTPGMIGITGRAFENAPPVGGYNLCYVRPGATMAALTVDEYKAPIVSAWQAGAGRSLCYTSEADGQYAGPIARWGEVGNLFAGMARWTAGDVNTLAVNLLLTQQVTNGIARIQLHLDPDRDSDPFN
ncbi:MAG TPA: VWA domain-containing protein, partial [Blastocatellia bacterium]|nr:VWA domain-containing protein [Blastocatellia bacterium]